MPAKKKGIGEVTKLLLNAMGAATAGAGVGAGIGVAHRKLFPYSMMDAPEESFEMPVLPQARGVTPTKPKKVKKAAVSVDLARVGGGLAGIPAGYGIVTMLMDRARSRQLDKMLASEDQSLNRALLQEQALTAKQAEVDEALHKLAGDLYDAMSTHEKKAASASVGKDLSGLYKQLAGLPDVQKQMLGALAGLSLMGGGVYGYRRAAGSDEGRAKMKRVRKALAERLREGDLISPIILKVRQPKPSMVPLKPGASSLDPSKGRDVLEGI